MVFLAITEIFAEIAFWTMKKSVKYSWRGLWWGLEKIRGHPTDVQAIAGGDAVDQELKLLKNQVEKQEAEIEELRKSLLH
uniref:Uncharacterized protein n=1 Tax=viral metagenome TaxID=1070528 RepID=A0A6C0BPM8_9ZZZZ